MNIIPKFEYLNEEALSVYIAAVENGLRDSEVKKLNTTNDISGNVGISGTGAGAKHVSSEEKTVSYSDHSSYRFKRLLETVRDNPEEFSWNKISQPDIDLPHLQTGEFVEWECDLYVPETVAAFQKGSQLNSMMGVLGSLIPFAKSMNLETAGLPSADAVSELGNVMTSIDITPLVVGDDEDANQKIIGKLDPNAISSDISTIDGRFIVVGKVDKQIHENRWYPLLPFQSLSRAQRREAEKNGPSGQDSNAIKNFIKGPATVLDVLAIYK